jgi:hypothetical protein
MSGGASRQKSCNACVRSKRRCDKTLPACARCTKKGWPCVYGGSQLDSSGGGGGGAFDAGDLVGLGGPDMSVDMDMDLDLDMNPVSSDFGQHHRAVAGMSVVPDFLAPMSLGGGGGLDVNLGPATPSDDHDSHDPSGSASQYDNFIETLINPKAADPSTWLSDLPRPANAVEVVPSRKDYSSLPHMCVS